MVDVRGHAEDFERVGAELRALGDRKLELATKKAIRADIIKPVGDQVLAALAAAMPRRGGLSARVASGRVGVAANLAKGITLTLSDRGRMKMSAFEVGSIRHPVYGNRKVWKAQAVPAGSAAAELEKHADEVASKVLDALGAAVGQEIK